MLLLLLATTYATSAEKTASASPRRVSWHAADAVDQSIWAPIYSQQWLLCLFFIPLHIHRGGSQVSLHLRLLGPIILASHTRSSESGHSDSVQWPRSQPYVLMG